MEQTIFAQIRKEAEDFYNGFISPAPGYDFNQYDTIKRAHLYHSSRYETGGTYLDRELLFYNVVNPPCEVAAKMLNVDTKNIRLYPQNPKSYFSTFLLEKELKLWLKTSKYSRILNQVAEEAPIYGSVVIEKTKDGAKVVDIRRLINDPSVDNIQNSRFITTVHYMTPSELEKTGWDNVDVAIERFGNSDAQPPFEDKEGSINQMKSTPYIKVFKRYGEVPEFWLKGGKSQKLIKALFIVAGADEQELNANRKPVGEKGVILFESKWHKEWPFKDFHYTKVKGRWLGVGIIESLFDVQVRMNELKNQKRFSMELSSLHLFQTKDKSSIVRNVLTDLQNGDILLSPNGIEPVVNEERNLQAFESEEGSYGQQVDKISFAYEAVRGETPASSTPLGTTQIVTAQATGVFGFKRENLTIAIREFFNELVMEELMGDLSKEHMMRFVGSAQELQKLDEAASEIEANDFVKEMILSGQIVTKEDVDARKQEFLQKMRELGENRFLKIKDAFYDDAEFEFDYIIDNENVDPQILAQNLKQVIGDLAGNPAILQDPRLKLLYFKFAETVGVNPAELELADAEAQKMVLENPESIGLPAPEVATA